MLAARKVHAKLQDDREPPPRSGAPTTSCWRTAPRGWLEPTAPCRSKTLARAAYHQAHLFKGEIDAGLSETATYDPAGTFSNACHAAIVEVDADTGRVTIERFVIAEDAGRLVNPMIVDGQVMGGVAQGIGNALLEEIVYDDTGNMLTATLADFLPPTCREIPPIELFAPGNVERRDNHEIERARRRRRDRRAGRRFSMRSTTR